MTLLNYHKIESLLVCILILTFNISHVKAYNLRSINNAENLSGSTIVSLYQDKKGVMWIGTTRGLDLYDGKHVIEYNPTNHTHSLTGSRVDKILSTEDDLIWVQTYHGLYKIDIENQTSESFDMFNRMVFSDKDSKGNLFIVQGNNSIYYTLNDKSNFDQIFIPDLQAKDIIDFLIDEKDCIWIFRTGGNNLCYSIHSTPQGNIRLHQEEGYIHPGKIHYGANNSLNQLYFIDSENILYEFDTNRREANRVADLSPYLDRRETITALLKSHNDFFIGFKTDGLAILKKQEESYSFEKIPVQGGVSCLQKDNFQNIVWIGTSGQGLYTYSVDQYSIKSVRLSDFTLKVKHPVQALFLDKENTLWIGSKGDGIIRIYDYHPDRHITDHRMENLTVFNSMLRDNVIYSFSKSKDGNIWIGTEEGIHYFSHATGKIIPISLFYKGDMIKSVSDIYEQDNTLWISTMGMGVLKAKIDEINTIPSVTVQKCFTMKEWDEYTNYFTSLYPESDSVLWCMNKGEGLLKINVFTNEQEQIRLNGNTINETNGMIKEKGSNYLIGTNSGLIEYQSGSYEILHETIGFPTNSIYSILPYSYISYWISTNRGIIYYNSFARSFRIYDHHDGLSVLEFNEGASFKDEKNNLFFFGGTNGFVTIQPNYFDEGNHYMPPVFFNTITIRDKQCPVADFISYKGKYPTLELSHEQNFFSLSFSAIDHLHGNNYSYYYKLDGANKEWIHNGNSDDLFFANLQPGKYKLSVKYYNKVLGKESYIYRINIRVLPPWYKSWVAYAVYFILFLLVVLFVSWRIIKRNKERKATLLAKLEQKHKEEIYEAKLQFFTNIAHEFCTPLTLIYGPCNQIMEQKHVGTSVLKYTQIIKQNAERLNSLIHDLIEFNRIESGYKKPIIVPIDMSDMVNEIVDSFAHMAEAQQIHLERDISPFIQWNSDKDFVATILLNLLSNAFKYTSHQKRIKVKLKIIDDKLSIVISNTGRGIPKKDISTIFDRYHILRNFEYNEKTSSWSRNGLGLAISYNMVHLLKGTIEVESVQEDWTHFCITLPYQVAEVENESKNLSYSLPDYSSKQIAPLSVPVSNPDELKPTLLIVDDETDICWLIYDLFKNEFNILTASDVNEAIEILKDIHPDIIISDVVMEGTDGISFSQQIKSDEKTAHIPFILLSAKQDIEERIEGLNAGAELYITKPFNNEYLKSSVRRLLERKESLREYFSSPLSSYTLENGKLSHKEHKKFMKEIIQIINKNIQNKELSANLIAVKMNMGVRTLYRKLEEIGDISLSDLIANSRLKVAAGLLTKTKLTIDEIVFKSGFTNRSSFYRAFSKKYGCTPTEYRQQHVIK